MRTSDDLECMISAINAITWVKCALQQLKSCLTTYESNMNSLHSVNNSLPITFRDAIEMHQDIFAVFELRKRRILLANAESESAAVFFFGIKAGVEAVDISSQLQICPQKHELESLEIEFKQKP